MLYALHEMQRIAWAPARMMAEAGRQAASNPLLPMAWHPAGRAVGAFCELFERLSRKHGKPEFGIRQVPSGGRTLAVREEVAASTPFCDLLHFEREGRTGDTVVLLVAPLSGHFATLLRDTVRGLLAEHDVYITDWQDARQVPAGRGPFTLDDYIDTLLDFLARLGPEVHLVAVCQPSVPALAATALLAAAGKAAPRSLVLMGGPIDTRVGVTKVNEFAGSHSRRWFEQMLIQTVPPPYPGFGRRVYPGFMQLSGFMGMNLDRHVGAHLRMFEHLVTGDGESAEAHRSFYDEYLAVMDMPAEYFLETVQRVFQEHHLPRGLFTHRGAPVDTAAIRDTALMTVEGERDDISGVGQTEAAHRLCPNVPPERRRHRLQARVGHYGIFNGRRWRQEILPDVADFIRAARA